MRALEAVDGLSDFACEDEDGEEVSEEEDVEEAEADALELGLAAESAGGVSLVSALELDGALTGVSAATLGFGCGLANSAGLLIISCK